MIEHLLAAGADANAELPEGETPVMTASRARHRRGRAGPHRGRGRRERGGTLARPDRPDVGGGPGSRRRDRHPRAPRGGRRGALEGAPADDARRGHQRVAVRPGVVWNRGGFTAAAVRGPARPRRGGRDAARRRRRRGEPGPDRRVPRSPSPRTAARVRSGPGCSAAAPTPTRWGPDTAPCTRPCCAATRALVRALLAHGADPNLRLRSGTPVPAREPGLGVRPGPGQRNPLLARGVVPRRRRHARTRGSRRRPPAHDPRALAHGVRAGGGVGPPHLAGGFIPPLVAATRGPANRGRFFNSVLRDANDDERKVMAAVRTAVEFGADVNAADLRGDTAMHAAAQRNFNTVVRFWPGTAPTSTRRTTRARTPLDLARAAEATRAPNPGSHPVSGRQTAPRCFRDLGAEDERSADSDRAIRSGLIPVARRQPPRPAAAPAPRRPAAGPRPGPGPRASPRSHPMIRPILRHGADALHNPRDEWSTSTTPCRR